MPLPELSGLTKRALWPCHRRSSATRACTPRGMDRASTDLPARAAPRVRITEC